MKKIIALSVFMFLILLLIASTLFKLSERQITGFYYKIDERMSRIEEFINQSNDVSIEDTKQTNMELISEKNNLLDEIVTKNRNITVLELENSFLNDIYITTLREMNKINKDTDITKIALNGVNVVDVQDIKNIKEDMTIVMEDEIQKHIIINNVNIIYDKSTGKMCKMYIKDSGELSIDDLVVIIGDDYFDVVSKTSSYVDSFLSDYPYKFTGEYSLNDIYKLNYYTNEDWSELSRPLLTEIEIYNISFNQ